jgi:hypothetical protein
MGVKKMNATAIISDRIPASALSGQGVGVLAVALKDATAAVVSLAPVAITSAASGSSATTTMVDTTVEDLLDFVTLEYRLKGLGRYTRDTMEATVSTDRAFLEANGCGAGSLVPVSLMDQAARAIATGNWQQEGLVVPAKSAGNRAYRSRIAGLLRAHVAARTNFAIFLHQLLKSSGLKRTVVVKQCGRPLHWLMHLLSRRCGGVTGITPDAAALLDKILHAKGMLFATYVAHAQSAAFEPFVPAIDQVLGWNSFARQLCQGRKALGLTLRALLQKVYALTRIQVDDASLCHWEQGFHLPSLGLKAVVVALDSLFGAGEALVKAWEAEGPRKALPSYGWPSKYWNPSLNGHLAGLVDYKQTNTHDLLRSDAPGGDRWTDPSRIRCIDTLERFFGFLLKEKGFPPEGLSLTLVADWPLVVAFFDFVRQRMERESYSQEAQTIASVFINLHAWYLPHLVDAASQEAYWQNRLHKQATGTEEVAAGVFRPYVVELEGFTERWNYHLYLTKRQARKFLNTADFKIGSLVGRAARYLDSEFGQADIVPVVEALFRRLPRRNLCRRAALEYRDLVVAVLSLTRCFRPETQSLLRTDQFTLLPHRRVHVKVPVWQLKNGEEEDTTLVIDGELTACDWMNELVWLYLVEARPVLIGGAARLARPDAGFFLVPAYIQPSGSTRLQAGGPLDKELIRRAARSILGCSVYGQRHMFPHDAVTHHHQSKAAVAGVLLDKVETLEDHYLHETAASRTHNLNATVEAFLFHQVPPAAGK